LPNRRLLLCLHTIFRALIYWAHRAVILAIAWHLVRSGTDLISTSVLVHVLVLLVGATSFKKAKGSVVSNRMWMKLGRNVLQVN